MKNLAVTFEHLMERVRAGCPDAQRELFEQFGPAVQRVVRLRLQRRLRSRYDPEDFTQSVWASFFQTPVEQYAFPTPAALVAFLSRMASRKVMEALRKRLGTLRHGSARAESLDAPHPDEDGTVGNALPGRLATPSQIVIADERWQKLVRGLPSGHRRVLELLRDGYKPADIARVLQIHRKVIDRLLEELNRTLEAS